MPFQIVPAPPSPIPGMKAPKRRKGSAFSPGSCRIVIVSSAGSCTNSCRTAYLSSSRICGRAKSVSGKRILPRSNPTTFNPALVSSRARMLPVQPIPMMTASAALSRVTKTRGL